VTRRPNPFYIKIDEWLLQENKVGQKVGATSANFEKLPMVNNRPCGENSPNLVTLLEILPFGGNEGTMEETTTEKMAEKVSLVDRSEKNRWPAKYF
jgi:hypothetical protein